MPTIHSRLGILGLLSLLLLGLVGFRGASGQVRSERDIMRWKLELAQEILQALVLEDLGTVKDDALKLERLANAAEWQVMDTPDYKNFSGEFRRVAKSLAEQAGDQSLENSAEEFASLTIRCVQCHKYVRGVRRAE